MFCSLVVLCTADIMFVLLFIGGVVVYWFSNAHVHGTSMNGILLYMFLHLL